MSPSNNPLYPPAYRPDIDGLRAIAVISVLLHHAFPRSFRTGYIGVDIFFVISGFLISAILFRSLEQGRFSILEFYIRRVRRIFPALLVVMASCYAFGWYALFSSEFAMLGEHILGGAGFVANLLLWSEAGYFDGVSEIKPLLHLWSLGVEEQFYIVWPLLLWATWRRHIGFLLVTVLLMTGSFAWNIVDIVRSDDTAMFYSPVTRFWELLTGGWVAYVFQHQDKLPTLKRFFRERANWLAWLGGLLLVTGLWVLKGHHAYPGYRALLPVLGAALLIAAGPDTWINRRLLAHPWMVAIGLISYPLYLWHWPILSFMRIIHGDTPPVTYRWSALLLSLLLAWLSWRWIEHPFRSGAWSGRRGVLGLMLGMLLLSGVAGWTVMAHGLEWRTANTYAKPLGSRIHYTPYQKQAHADCYTRMPWLRDEVRCGIFGSDPEFMVIGDSHAESMFLPAEEENGMAFPHVRIDSPACLPFTQYNTRFPQHSPRPMACNLLAPDILRALEGLPGLKTVILVTRGSFYFTAEDFHRGPNTGHPIHRLSDDKRLEGADAERAFVEGYIDLARRLLAMGKQVVFVLEWPELDFDPAACVRRQVPWDYRQDCQVARHEVNARQLRYRQLVQEISQSVPDMRVYDPFSVLCDDEGCRVRDGDRLYYRDDDHLSTEGASMVLEDFLRWYENPLHE